MGEAILLCHRRVMLIINTEETNVKAYRRSGAVGFDNSLAISEPHELL